MSQLTVQEFVVELVMGLEERLEGGFTPGEDNELVRVLTAAVNRMESEDA